MSWHFSQALVEAYSEANSSDGRPSAPLSGKPTPQAYLSPDRMKAFSRLSRFGMTCEPLTDDLGAAVLTWCLAASPAKTSAQPAKAPESTESAAECGRTWRESFARWDRDTSSWRTPQCSLLEGLDVFSETWPQWGMMRGGECSVQTMPVLRTSGTGSGSWLTPNANDSKPAGPKEVEMMRIYETGTNVPDTYKRLRSQATARQWPTVRARMWPTPTAHNAKEQDSASEATLNTPTLCHQARGGDKTQPKNLNPVWVEWLMGWPLGWTDLKPLATDKFQSWRHSHGGF